MDERRGHGCAVPGCLAPRHTRSNSGTPSCRAAAWERLEAGALIRDGQQSGYRNERTRKWRHRIEVSGRPRGHADHALRPSGLLVELYRIISRPRVEPDRGDRQDDSVASPGRLRPPSESCSKTGPSGGNICCSPRSSTATSHSTSRAHLTIGDNERRCAAVLLRLSGSHLVDSEDPEAAEAAVAQDELAGAARPVAHIRPQNAGSAGGARADRTRLRRHRRPRSRGAARLR